MKKKIKAQELNRRISEVVYTVMKSKGVVEYNDYHLQEEIRKLIMPFINQFEKELLTDFLDFLLKNGYCDTDVYAEPPTAIDQYLIFDKK